MPRDATAAAVLCLVVVACSPDSSRSDWPSLGISIDKLGITKTLIDECCFRGYVRSIQLGNFDSDSNLELAVVPQTGVYLFDPVTLTRKAQIDFPKADGDVIWFGLAPYLIAKKPGFSIAKRGGGFGDIGLLDQSGKQVWNFKPNPKLPPPGMVVDDVVNDGPRFYVCDRGTIYRLDALGAITWKIAEDADHIVLVRDKEDEEAGFATAGYQSQTLNVWTAAGTLAQTIRLPFEPDGLAFVRWGSISGFVAKSGAQVAFVDRSGKHLFTYSYGSVPVRHGPSAVLVRLLADQPPLLAVLSTSRSATGKSVLTVMSLDGSRLYEEYLDGGPALGVVPAKDRSSEKLIVGEGTKKLWAYEKASPNPSMQPTGQERPAAD